MGSGFLILVEVFPVKTFRLVSKVCEVGLEGRGEEAVVTGGEEEALGVAFQKEVGITIAFAVKESDGIGLGRQEFLAQSEGGGEV